MRHISSKRILSLLLVLTMVVGLVPVTVFAAETKITYTNEAPEATDPTTEWVLTNTETGFTCGIESDHEHSTGVFGIGGCYESTTCVHNLINLINFVKNLSGEESLKEALDANVPKELHDPSCYGQTSGIKLAVCTHEENPHHYKNGSHITSAEVHDDGNCISGSAYNTLVTSYSKVPLLNMPDWLGKAAEQATNSSSFYYLIGEFDCQHGSTCPLNEYCYNISCGKHAHSDACKGNIYTWSLQSKPTYTVTFNANEGTGTMADQTVYKEVSVALTANAYTRTGYTFTGWNTKADGTGDTYTDTQSVALEENLSLYAQWKAIVYDITWLDESGKTLETTQVAYGETPVAPVAIPARDGYTGVWSPAISKVDGAKSYQISYTQRPTVTFTANNGTEDSIIQFLPENETDLTLNANAFNYEGYRFNGWNTAADGTGTAYADGATIADMDKNITLYAQWVKQVTVVFDSNGGSAVENATKTVDINTEIAKPADPVKNGLVFDAWYVSDTAVTFPVKVDKDITYTANWKVEITFDAAGGSAVDSILLNVNEPITTVPESTLDGYSFAGWYTVDDTKVTEDTAFTTSTKLTAKWSKIMLDTEINVESESVTVTYGEDPTALIGAKVVEKGTDTAVAGAEVSYSEDLSALAVGKYEVTIRYAGDADHNSAVYETVEVTVNKATAEITVANQTYKFGEGPEVADPINTNGVAAIEFVAGLDAHDETKLVGVINVALPLDSISNPIIAAGIDDLLKDYGTTDLPIDDFLALLKDAKGIFSSIDELIDGFDIDQATIDKLIETIQTYADALPMDTEVVINIVSQLELPSNVGVYLVGAVSADNNYETALGFGYLVITPNGIQVELSWNEEDENGIYTIPAFKAGNFDLGATATIVDSTIDGGDDYVASVDPNDHIEYIYIGADADGNLILDAKLASDSKAGIYAEVAYVANWDNNMYYAAPIVRPILLAPGVADVTFVDENGNENYARTFTYDGTAKEMKALVNGEADVDGLTVTYIGLDFHGEGYNNGEGYNDTEKPTESGLYAVVALYREYNDDGNLEVIGGAVGAMMIEQVEPEQFEMEAETTVIYDGNTHFPALTMDKAYDVVTIAIDRENNVAYVNMPADMDDHIAKLPAEVQEQIAELIGLVKEDDVQMSTVKTLLNDTVQKMIDLELADKIEEVLGEVAAKLETELKDRIDTEALKAQLDAKIEELKAAVKTELPEEIVDMLEEYITLNSSEVDVDIDGLKAELKAQLEALADTLPPEVVEELTAMVDELVAAAQGNATVAEIKATVEEVLAKLEALEIPDAETLVKAAVGALAGVIDTDQVKEVVDAVIEKIDEQAVVDEAIALVKNIASMYKGDIDSSALESAVDALIEKIKAKAESGTLDDNDLVNLEAAVDDILTAVQGMIDQLPEGTIIFNQNPSAVGEYDCYAMNISANYKPTFLEGKLYIVEPEDSTCEHEYAELVKVDPTCEEDGYITYKCIHCESPKKEILPKHDHVWGDWEVTKEATYTEEGVETRKCECEYGCGCIETRTIAKKKMPAVLPKLFNIYVETNEGGSVPGLGADGHAIIALYADRTLKFVCEEGYEIADVIVNGRSVGAVSKYKIQTAICDYRIEVVFQPIPVVEETPAEEAAE